MSTLLELPDELALIKAAKQWVGFVPEPALIYLSGDLGAGKSTFVRAALGGLGFSGRVKSPTFSLLETYQFDNKLVHHLDLYRLSDPEELEFLGFRDLVVGANFIFIEWPEQAEGYLPQPNYHLQLDYAGEGRTMSISKRSM